MANDENANWPTLNLVKECKIHELLRGVSSDDSLEASGVFLKNNYYYIVLDNIPHLVKLEKTLEPKSANNLIIRQRGENDGFEDITFHEADQRYLVVIEAKELGRSADENDEDGENEDEGIYQPLIEEYNLDLRYIQSLPLDYMFEKENKGIEGITYVYRNGQDYLLGLCEGNKCKGGDKGRKPGDGRVFVFERRDTKWKLLEKIKLPKSLLFEDYSALDVRNNKLAVVSQSTSALWIGKIREDEWEIDGEGVVYGFPKNEDNEIVYCTVEGVTWISPAQLAFVSDIKKGSQGKRCKEKDQSIHIFEIPNTD